MQTTLDMGDQDLINVNDIKAKGNITTNSMLANVKIEADSIHAKKRLSTGEFLQVDGPVNEGGSCSGKLLGITANGIVLSCQSGRWLKVNKPPTFHTEIHRGPTVCGAWEVSRVSCPPGYLLTGGGYGTDRCWGTRNIPEQNFPENENTWLIALPGRPEICSHAQALCTKFNH